MLRRTISTKERKESWLVHHLKGAYAPTLGF